MSILTENQNIGNYTVQTFIKKGMYDETYFVTDEHDVRHFLKLFIPSELPNNAKSPSGQVLEIAYLQLLNHPSVMKYEGCGNVCIDGIDYPYLVASFVNGELIETIQLSGRQFSVENVLQIALSVLGGLSHIHSKGLIHCDITPRNIICRNEGEESIGILIDFGHLSKHPLQSPTFLLSDLEPWYRAPESFRGSFTPQSDVFSFAAVLYSMLYGKAPWELDNLSPDDDEKALRSKVHMARKESLSFAGRDDVPNWLQEVLRFALSVKPDDRVQSADELMELIAKQGEGKAGPKRTISEHADRPSQESNDNNEEKNEQGGRDERGQISVNLDFKVGHGNGFADVAGMDDLKMKLQQQVLFVLKNKKKAEAYRLAPLNGMLLYGPPGCGKTYFAQKFAEESGFKFCVVKGSDLGSIYIHGSQTMIADLFKKAEANAPVIICIDEIDALIPRRGARGAEGNASEVNEFLSQMNECGKRGIFVVGTTNRRELIDTAALRKGRFDLQVEVPVPDQQTRKLMYDLHLKDRPCAEINTMTLSEASENYVASDIAYIVNDAALVAALRDEPITEETLLNSIRHTKPSTGDRPARVGF